MGDYKLENTRTALLRKVYKKTDGKYFLFYNRKFYLDDNVKVKIFIILGNGFWIVYNDITSNNGWIKSEKTGLLTPPRTDWLYWDGTAWTSDTALEFNIF